MSLEEFRELRPAVLRHRMIMRMLRKNVARKDEVDVLLERFLRK